MFLEQLSRKEIHCRLPAGQTEIRLTRYGPADTDWAVLVLPGGGYGLTAADREGYPVAKAFVQEGYAAAVLEYSVAPDRWPLQMLEAAAAIALLRRRGAKRVAVCGFSAGGHLAACASNLWNSADVSEVLKLAPEEVRPDASILCYPVITAKPPLASKTSFCHLIGEGKAIPPELSLEDVVSNRTPPAFLWATVADGSVPVENTMLYASALRGAGVPFELHLYPRGPHAMALADGRTAGRPEQQDPHVASWFPLCVEWLREV